MKYRIVLPRILIVSREMVSPGAVGFVRVLVVIFTARSAVFIWGETEVTVPWTIVPFFNSIVTVSLAHFIRNLTVALAIETTLPVQTRKLFERVTGRKSYLTSFMLTDLRGHAAPERWCWGD